MSQTNLLYRLQSLDSKVDKANRQLTEVTNSLGESEIVKKTRALVEGSGQVLRQVQTTLKDLELEEKSLSDKIKNQEKLLYSGKALAAKEAANLQEEIASLKRWHATREELLLETMVEVEEKEDILKKAQKELAVVEATWQTDQEDLLKKQADLKREITSLLEQRPSIATIIPSADLDEYEILRKKKAGVAVAGVKDNTCQACGIMVSSNKVRQARIGAELMYCGTCGRILYIF